MLKIKKIAFLIMIITLLSKILGFGRDIFLSYYFGASNVSDAYLISLTVPEVIFSFIATGIVTAYIPMQSRVINEFGDEEGSKFTSNFTNIILTIVAFIFLIGILFTEDIVKLFASGFSDDTLSLASNFTRITLIGMFFTVIISIFSGYLQIKKNFLIPTLIGFPFNVIIIISIIFASKGNYYILAFGTLIATASQLFIILPFVKKEGFKYSFLLNFRDDKIIKVLHIALPVIIGTSVTQINKLIDRSIASSLAIGGISALNYASRLNLFIQTIFVTSIITVIYPMISSYASKKNHEGIKKVLIESINIIVIFLLPITIGFMIFNKQIINLLFGRGAFDDVAIQMTSTALFFYSIGMLGFGLREVLARGFYSIQDTKTPMINAAIGMIINIILNIILSRILGIGGLALATSISALVTTTLLFISFRKKIGPFGMKQIIISFLKILLPSLIMGVIAKVCFNYFISYLALPLSLSIAILIGAISYFIIIYFLGIEEVNVIVNTIKRKIGINNVQS